MKIGSDVVLLNPFRSMTLERLGRYLSKICDSEEGKWILEAKDPHYFTGITWSVKEAAYKIWSKKTGQRRLNPKKFHFHSASHNLPEIISFSKGIGLKCFNMVNEVIDPDDNILVIYSVMIHHPKTNEDYAFSIAKEHLSDIQSMIHWEIEYCPENKIQQSKRVRTIFNNRVGAEREKHQTPFLIEDSSFSHDGSAIAYSFITKTQDGHSIN